MKISELKPDSKLLVCWRFFEVKDLEGTILTTCEFCNAPLYGKKINLDLKSKHGFFVTCLSCSKDITKAWPEIEHQTLPAKKLHEV